MIQKIKVASQEGWTHQGDFLDNRDRLLGRPTPSAQIISGYHLHEMKTGEKGISGNSCQSTNICSTPIQIDLQSSIGVRYTNDQHTFRIALKHTSSLALPKLCQIILSLWWTQVKELFQLCCTSEVEEQQSMSHFFRDGSRQRHYWFVNFLNS